MKKRKNVLIKIFILVWITLFATSCTLVLIKYMGLFEIDASYIEITSLVWVPVIILVTLVLYCILLVSIIFWNRW